MQTKLLIVFLVKDCALAKTIVIFPQSSLCPPQVTITLCLTLLLKAALTQALEHLTSNTPTSVSVHQYTLTNHSTHNTQHPSTPTPQKPNQPQTRRKQPGKHSPFTMTQGYYLASSRYQPSPQHRSTYTQQPQSAFDWDSSDDSQADHRNRNSPNRSRSTCHPQRNSPSPDRFYHVEGFSGNGLSRRGAIRHAGQSESRFARERASQRSTGASSGILSSMLRGLNIGSYSRNSNSSSRRSRSARSPHSHSHHNGTPSRQPSQRDNHHLPQVFMGSDGTWRRGDTGRPLESSAESYQRGGAGLRRTRTTNNANPYADPYVGAHAGYYGRGSHDISGYEGMPQRMMFSRGQHPSARRSCW